MLRYLGWGCVLFQAAENGTAEALQNLNLPDPIIWQLSFAERDVAQIREVGLRGEG